MTRLAGFLLLSVSFAFAGEQVPFVAMFTSSVPNHSGPAPTWCDPPFVVPVATVGAGHATHLGRFSSQEGICLNPVTDEFAQGQFVLVGANGDTIIGTSNGFTKFIDGRKTIRGSFIIDGGSGRFQNASGSGSATGTVNSDGSVSDFVMTGTITRPNH